MALLTHSETLAFNGFLSSIDFGDSLEWSGINPDTIPLTPAQGKEALAKATKDLMSLEPNLHDAEMRPPPAELNTHWPSFRSEQAPQHGYTYGFDVSSSARPHRAASSHTTSDQRRSPSQDLFSGPRSRSPRSRDAASTSSSSSFAPDTQPRPGPYAAASAPAVLNRSASSSKRSLPDGDWQGSSAGAKRRRPSVVAAAQQQQQQQRPQADSPAPPSRSTRASSVSSSATAAGTADATAKPALLSPSQKRANHIQSEQKRRANIRKGYEALCDVVPALRDAIRAEEETARAGDDKPKRKKKGKAEEDKQDGRAGPKSENVVLQKTIDHVKALLAERGALSLRLHQARGALPHGHPALAYAPHHLDDKGALLWEREWTGGTGWGDVEDDGGDDE